MRIYSHLGVLFNFLMPALPQMLGLLTFFIIVKTNYFDSSQVVSRLVYYQMSLSVASLINLGISYSKAASYINRNTLLMLMAIVVSIFIVSFIRHYDIFFSLFFGIFTINSLIGLKILKFSKENRFTYLYFAIFSSIFLPFSLIFNIYFIFLVFVIQSLVFWKLCKFQNTSYSYKLFTKDLFFSVLFQSPFFLLAIFDYNLKEIIGDQLYLNYTLVLKFTNGAVLFVFSKYQLDILYEDLSAINQKKLKITSCIIPIIIFSITYLSKSNFLFFVIEMLLLSIQINTVSLLVRINIKYNKFTKISYFIPLVSIFFYFIFLKVSLKHTFLAEYYIFVMSISYLILIQTRDQIESQYSKL